MTDDDQRAIIALREPSALVLAGPGCGKTHILARRIAYAHSHGVPFAQMACLTFTNRAARHMLEQTGTVADADGATPDGLFVGNLHRFCLRLLFENELIHPDTTILDDKSFEDYCARTFGYTRTSQCEALAKVARAVYQNKHHHPPATCLPDGYVTQDIIPKVVRYVEFKEECNLMDFDDILLQAFTALRADKGRQLAKAYYSWLQIDEVQDLTSLHLAIIEEIATPDAVRLYLGDEQQAIFSFLGAGGAALETLKSRCRGAIYHLTNNYRSCPRLLDLTNTLATRFLGISPEFLPVCRSSQTDKGEAMLYVTERDCLAGICSAWVQNMSRRQGINSVMVLVRTNRQGEEISQALSDKGIDHIFPGRTDVFRSAMFRTIWSHLAVVLNDGHFQQWAEIIYRCRAVKNLATARRLVAELKRVALSPACLLDLFSPTDCERLCGAVAGDRPIVVIDTETTGLDIENDDIVQLAAVKIRDGKVSSDRFNVFIDSALPLPSQINGAANPVHERYDKAERCTADSAFAALIDFVGSDAVIAGHNVEFDLAMLRNNLRRRTGMAVPQWMAYGAPVLDSLRLARLLLPTERSYRLEALCRHFGIGCEETHTADADAAVTAALLLKLYPHAECVLPLHAAARRNEAVVKVSRKFAEHYKDFYTAARRRVFDGRTMPSTLTTEIMLADTFFAGLRTAVNLRHAEYVCRLIDLTVVNPLTQRNLYTQLSTNLNTLLTFNEGDFFANDIVDERVRVMTVHKAKGLEADAVIIYDVCRGPGRFEDYLRLLYVAFSRARKVLVAGAGDWPGTPVDELEPMFHRLTANEIRSLVRGCRT